MTLSVGLAAGVLPGWSMPAPNADTATLAIRPDQTISRAHFMRDSSGEGWLTGGKRPGGGFIADSTAGGAAWKGYRRLSTAIASWCDTDPLPSKSVGGSRKGCAATGRLPICVPPPCPPTHDAG